MERNRPSEANPEKHSIKEIYEHLFPGNEFRSLPVLTISGEVWAAVQSFLSSEDIRKERFATAINDKRSHAEREDIEMIDKVISQFILRDLTPLLKATHPTFYDGNSFDDLVDVHKGEKLGGAAERIISWNRHKFIDRMEITLGGDPYMKKHEIVLGVLDANSRPAAIIHFIEGENKRRGKKAKVELLGFARLPEPGFTI